MTAPPLPETSTLRVRLDYQNTDETEAGNRFFISYAGAAPTPGNCASIASDIAAAWATNIAPNVIEIWALKEVDVLDITTLTGASGQWTGDNAGGASGTFLPAQVAVNVEFGIARRYRGGKPRIFFPPPTTAEVLDSSHWASSFVTGMGTAVEAFFAEVEAISVGAVGALQHVNVSFYSGFTNHINTSGRERPVPTYRATALVEPVNSYAVKAVFGSQKRRRTATSY